MHVRIYHNVAQDELGRPMGFYAGYSPEHPMVLVDEADLSSQDTLEEAFHLYNVGDDPDFGEPNPIAVAYRARRNRSLSVGDVVCVEGNFYACQSIGWALIPEPIIVSSSPLRGSTPLHLELMSS